VFINRTVIKVGTTERREREREQLRARIVEAARDILSDDGLAGLSMRAIAERIEYSPATIYLYFKDKDELIRDVVLTGFEGLGEAIVTELRRAGETAPASEQYRAMGRAYARFAIENPSYFRVMFELPATAHFECEEPHDQMGFDGLVALVSRAVAEGQFGAIDPTS
jgi:AcrR family transcriptional regulator